jgi:hypothetical protein
MSPKEALPFLEEMLRPVPVASEATVARLIAALNSRLFKEREDALLQLCTLEKPAEFALRKALAGELSLEVRRRLEDILAGIQDAEHSPIRLRNQRALLVLGYIKTAAARRHLHRLARGAEGAWLTEQARAALEHAGQSGAGHP